MTVSTLCDCGMVKSRTNGYLMCDHCDTGCDATCRRCKAYSANVMRRLNNPPRS